MTTLSPTKNQLEAINHFKGPLLIIAGPGSGKTRVLVERVTHLVKNRNVNPNKIFVTTFTVKASQELKARLNANIGPEAESMHVSTIHSFCHDILKEFSDFHDLGATFDVLDEEMQLMFIRNNYYHLGLKNLITKPKLPLLISFFNKCSENCIDPDELINEIKGIYQEYKKYDEYLGFAHAYKKYQELLEEDHKIDFPGLQKKLLQLLEENDDLLQDIRDKFDFILVDEYQDTNPVQDKLFNLISCPKCNLCIVGDDDQSIYAFRGADPENFMEFENRHQSEFNQEIKFVTLNRNFRSTSNIVTLFDKFMHDYRHYKKFIEPTRGKGNDVLLLKSEDVKGEAEEVVKLIKEMKEKCIIPHYGYVALLFKSVKYHASKIIAELKANDIPYTVKGDGKFLDQPEVQTMLYLMSYVDPPDYSGKFKYNWGKWWDISMFENEFLNLSPETVDALHNLDKTFDISTLLEENEFKEVGIKNEFDISKLMQLNLLKQELTTKEKDMLVIFYDILKISEYLNWLLDEGSEKSQAKMFNLAELSTLINKYEYLNSKPKIRDFLWYLYQLPENMRPDEKTLDNPHNVKIMTVHQAKGLEFPVVFICSVIKDRFPGRKRKDKELVPIPEKLLMNNSDESADEERRLFYVAMTRAQDNLIISTADKIKSRKVGYSPFVEELIEMGKLCESCEDMTEECRLNDEDDREPLNLSYSSIYTYDICPFRYKMAYYYGFEFPPSYMQNYGEILHNCLHKLHLAMKKGEKINGARIKDIVNNCWIKLHNNKKKDDPQRNILERRLLDYYIQNKHYIKEIISTEEPFSINMKDAVVTGRSDLIIKNQNDEVELVDFKARAEAGIEDTSVDFQLKMYKYALKNKYKIDKLCAYTFKDNKRVYFDQCDPEDLNKTLRDICENISCENFEPLENSFCSKCVFKFCC